jgi:cell division protein FtsL
VTRLNTMLFAVVMLCALGVVTSQHQARKLFVELQREQERGRELEIEYGQLQLEQSTWAMQTRIEQVASKQLGMRVPPEMRVRVVPPPPAPSNP